MYQISEIRPANYLLGMSTKLMDSTIIYEKLLSRHIIATTGL
jgi:hypothetical protein